MHYVAQMKQSNISTILPLKYQQEYLQFMNMYYIIENRKNEYDEYEENGNDATGNRLKNSIKLTRTVGITDKKI